MVAGSQTEEDILPKLIWPCVWILFLSSLFSGYGGCRWMMEGGFFLIHSLFQLSANEVVSEVCQPYFKEHENYILIIGNAS